MVSDDEQPNPVAAAGNLPPLPQISPPPTLKSTSSEDWDIFKLTWQNYAVIAQLDKHPKQYQRAIFLHVIGVTGLKLYNSIVFTALEEEDDVKPIIDKLERIIIGQVKPFTSPTCSTIRNKMMMKPLTVMQQNYANSRKHACSVTAYTPALFETILSSEFGIVQLKKFFFTDT